MNLKRAIFPVCFLFTYLIAIPFVHGGDLLSKFQPYISISEEYNDNLYLAPDNEQDDYITTISPGIKFNNMGPTSGIDLNYSMGAEFYKKNSDRDYIGHNVSLDAKYMTSHHINFYLSEYYIRSSSNREREYDRPIWDNQYVLGMQTQRAVYWRNVLSPTVEYQFGPEDRLGVNYRNNIYRSQAITAEDSQENYINPFFSYWFNRRNGIFLEYGYTKGDFDLIPDLTGHRVNGRYTNRFSAKSSAFVEFTYLKREFDSTGFDYDIYEPSIGITYAFMPTVTGSIQAGFFWKDMESGLKKDGMTYRGELTKNDPESRISYGLSFHGGYHEDFFTSQNLGFTRYHRVIGSTTYRPNRRTAVSLFGSFERANYDDPDRSDKIWGTGFNMSYMLSKWLIFYSEFIHNERESDEDRYDYAENKVMIRLTATYY